MSDQISLIYELREQVVFPSSNRWGLPELRDDRLADTIPGEVVTSRVTGRARPDQLFVKGQSHTLAGAGGTLCFYVDDTRFSAVWSQAVQWLRKASERGWDALVSPDFSTWSDDPMAVQLWAVYRNRWCARYWQEAGFSVIPSLSWSTPDYYDFAFVGVPVGAPVVMCQARTVETARERRLFVEGLRHADSVLRPQRIVIYGAKSSRWIPRDVVESLSAIVSWIPSWNEAKKGIMPCSDSSKFVTEAEAEAEAEAAPPASSRVLFWAAARGSATG